MCRPGVKTVIEESLNQGTSLQLFSSEGPRKSISHFRVPSGLCIKARLSAQPLIWKLFFILMQIKQFSQERLCTWPLFESEGFFNSEVDYSERTHCPSPRAFVRLCFYYTGMGAAQVRGFVMAKVHTFEAKYHGGNKRTYTHPH